MKSLRWTDEGWWAHSVPISLINSDQAACSLHLTSCHNSSFNHYRVTISHRGHHTLIWTTEETKCTEALARTSSIILLAALCPQFIFNNYWWRQTKTIFNYNKTAMIGGKEWIHRRGNHQIKCQCTDRTETISTVLYSSSKTEREASLNENCLFVYLLVSLQLLSSLWVSHL